MLARWDGKGGSVEEGLNVTGLKKTRVDEQAVVRRASEPMRGKLGPIVKEAEYKVSDANKVLQGKATAKGEERSEGSRSPFGLRRSG